MDWNRLAFSIVCSFAVFAFLFIVWGVVRMAWDLLHWRILWVPVCVLPLAAALYFYH